MALDTAPSLSTIVSLCDTHQRKYCAARHPTKIISTTCVLGMPTKHANLEYLIFFLLILYTFI